jgi:hypothetical protein
MPRRSLRAHWFRYRSAAVSVALGALVACSGNTDGMPGSWGPLVLGKEWRCPTLAGRYAYAVQPVEYHLAGRHVPWDSIPVELEYFEIAGSADTSLHLTVGYLDGRQHQKRLQKGTPYAHDYYCEDGWLHLRAGELSDTFDVEVASEGFFARRREMRIAQGKDGALVARLDRIDYDEFAVWCGDGCKGFALPWTMTTRSTWSRAEPWADGAPRPSVVQRRRASARERAEQARLQEDRLYQAEQLLENGPPVAGADEARTRVMAAVVPGMLVRGVTPRDSGWHLSIEFAERAQVDEFMDRLAQSGPVAELRVVPLYRARMTTGTWTDVVYVRYER